ncbi:MAG: hypothetical protein Fur0032_14330 [Terrimicrobiaceae bacterium]
MSDFTFGLMMAVVGMGGTLVTLSLIAMLIRVLTLFFPKKDGEVRR